ncbi:UDP-N-acetylglucosamine acyltransferase [Agromyces badenianii]|uniref:UDP-N-acetylglucosamine acyltransferase n=1 Tax=Agromyces badenianii TaxID=2080742 RepID=A0A2S0WX70_9MICO|nr:UDP-N-acetylglucosamine acyltransferase [Agromyces badenianii]
MELAGRGVTIGNRNVIREYAQIHQGWKSTTAVGDDAFIMNQVYVAHDCTLGDGVTLASSVLLAGHVTVGTNANLGLGTSVHQGRYIGASAMVGMSSVVTRDIPPFAKAYGSPARVVGANVVGMRRGGIVEEAVVALSALYESDDGPEALSGFSQTDGISEAVIAWQERHGPVESTIG